MRRAPQLVRPPAAIRKWEENWDFELVREARARHDRRRARRRTPRRGREVLSWRALRSKTAAAAAVAAAGISVAIVTAPGGAASVASGMRIAPLPASVSARALRDIPRRYLGLYALAARKYELQWSVLAAVGQIESNHGRSPLPGVRSATNYAGAAGPTQFLGSTWRRYGVDGDGDGRIDPYDPADAIASTAAFLKAAGAPQDWPRALYAYNHSLRYVDAVLRLSHRYDPRDA